jgi:hypothetical protein
MLVTEISKHAAIEPRALRYVLDHGIVLDSVEQDPERRGSPRTLDEVEAMAVSMAALMLKAGLKSKFVRGFVRAFMGIGGNNPKGQSMRAFLERPVDKNMVERLDIADRGYIRFIKSPNADVGWKTLVNLKPAPEHYVPLSVVSIDLAELRRRLLATK